MDFFAKNQAFEGPQSIKKSRKINKKSIKKMMDDKMYVGLDFRGLLGAFWKDFGRVWEAKLDQKSIKNRSKIDMER